MSQETLQNLLQQAEMTGNTELAKQLKEAIANAKQLKNPNSIEDWDDAKKAYNDGVLTIRKDSVREAAALLYRLAERNPEMRETVLQIFSRAMRGNGES